MRNRHSRTDGLGKNSAWGLARESKNSQTFTKKEMEIRRNLLYSQYIRHTQIFLRCFNSVILRPTNEISFCPFHGITFRHRYSALVSSCRVTNNHKCGNSNNVYVCYPTVSMGKESGHSLPRSSAQRLTRL